MARVSYRRYARGGRYKPIQLPDESQKLLSEGERLLRGMERAEDLRSKQARSTDDWRREKAQLEKENRQENFDLQQVYADNLKKSLNKNIDRDLKNFDVKIKEAELKSERNKQRDEFLTKMVPSLLNATSAAVTARDEVLYKNIKASIINAGLSNEELKTYLFTDNLTSESQASFEKIVAKLKNNGAISDDDRNNILNLSGRKKLQAQKYFAQNLGKSAYQTALNRPEHYNGKIYKLGDGRKLTFRQAISGQGTLSDLDNMYRQFDSAYYGHMNSGHIILAAESKPYIDKFKETQRNALTAARQKRNAVAHKTEVTQDVLASIQTLGSKDPGKQFIDWINRKGALSADRGYWRKQGISALSEAASTGELEYDVWLDIKNEYFKLDGQKKEVRFGDIYSNEVAVVDDAFTKFFKKQTDEAEQTYRNFDVSKRIAAAEFKMTEGRSMNNMELDALKEQFKPFGKIPTWLKDQRSQSEELKAEDVLALDRKANAGQLSYVELVNTRRYSADIIKKYTDKTYDGPNSVETKDIFSGITASVQSALGDLIPSDERGFEAKTMGTLAKNILRERVNEALGGKMYSSPMEAYIQEASKLNKEIKEGEGIWELKKNALGTPIRGINGGFKYLDSKFSRDYDTSAIAYEKAAKADKNGFLTNPNTIEQEDIQSLKNLAHGGKFPNFLGVLASEVYRDKDHYEIANALLRANGEDEVPPPGIAKVPQYVSENFKRLVLNKPSMAKTVESVTQTTRQLNPGTDEDEPVINLMKDKEAVAKGEYDFVKDKSGNTDNGKITELSTGDVYNTSRVGNNVEFGVFKFTGQEIGEAIDKGVIAPTDPFDADTQDTLFLERIEGLGEIKVDDYTLPGIGQAWVVEEVSTNQALRTVFGDVVSGLAKKVVKGDSIEAIAKVADDRQNMQKEAVKNAVNVATAGHNLRKAVINKIKDPATKEFFKRLGEETADLFLQGIAEVDELMKNYTINKRSRRLNPIDPNSTFSQRGINTYKLKPELFGEFYQ